MRNFDPGFIIRMVVFDLSNRYWFNGVPFISSISAPTKSWFNGVPG